MRVTATSFLVIYSLLSGGLLSPITAQSDSYFPSSDTLRIKSPAPAMIAVEGFNKGFNLNTSDLLLAQVAGLTISRPGSDPHQFIDIGIRDLSSLLSETRPLFLVDGVPVQSFDQVDPFDVESVQIIKTAADAARYGMRGAAGVVNIYTNYPLHAESKPLVRYRGSVSSSFAANQLEFLTPGEYRRYSSALQGINGTDYGSSTNWQERVLQSGISHRHHLSISGTSGTTAYSISGGYRYIDTIQQGADQDRVGARLLIRHRSFNNRLLLTGRASAAKQVSSLGFAEIFRYSNTFNPTAPIFDENVSYFENFLFDSFNPLAIQNEALRDQQFNDSRVYLAAAFDGSDWLKGTSIHAQISSGNRDGFLGQYYGKDLKFRGRDRNGLAYYETENSSDLYTEMSIRYGREMEKSKLFFEAGTDYQRVTRSGQFASGGDFLSDAYTYNSLQSASDFRNGDGFVDSFESIQELTAFFGSLSFQNRNLFDAGAHLRHESSSRLGSENRWGTFFGIWAGSDINRVLSIDGVDEAYLHTSYGITGQVPPFSGMASLTFQEGNEVNFGDRFSPSLFVPVSPNPELKWEQKQEFETGLQFKLFDESLTASVTYFRSRTDDLILLTRVPSPPNIAGLQWQNAAALSGRGFEVTLGYQESWGKFRWRSRLLVARAVSRYEQLPDRGFESLNGLLAFPGAPGLGNTQLNLIMEGENVGSLWGPRFAGFDTEGQWQFSTPEGEIVSNFEVNPDDYVVIGNGLPDFSAGWNHRFTYSNWDLEIFLQGEFGHDMINLNRLYYENPNYLRTGNVMASTPGKRLRAAPFFSDYYVEDASYIRLHTLSLGYSMEGLSSEISYLRIYITGNNLITLTGFDGTDPSVRLSSSPPTDNGSMLSGPRNYAAPGIERRNIWPTQTTLTAGIELAF